MTRIIGYARVSTEGQHLDMQIQALEKYATDRGLELIMYVEKASGTKKDRVELANAMKAVAKGDTFAVYKLDRLARSTRQLYEVTDDLDARGVDFVSIGDHLDTTTAPGKAMFGMLAVFAEFERNIISDRTKAGLNAARAKGKVGGRPTISDKTKRQVVALFNAGESATDIAKEFGIGRATVYKILNESK